MLPSNLNLGAWYDRLLFDSERSGLRVYKATTNEERSLVELEIGNTGYMLTADAVHKALSLAEANLPQNIKASRTSSSGRGTPCANYTISAFLINEERICLFSN